MISQEKSLEASVGLGEKYVYEYFSNHQDALRINDTTIYNRMVLETGYKPINSEVAVYILGFIGIMRNIFSNPEKLKLYNLYRLELVRRFS